jgi:ubiquinone/menaquinone biosynthesis C-methylase UbiE
VAHSEFERWSGFKSWAFSLVQGNAKRNEELVSFAGIGPGDRVLDIGCGPGAALESAVAAGADSVCGVDSSPAMVTRASKRVPTATVKEGSAETIPFDDDAFTAVWSIATFHHWADRDAGLREVQRVLAPRGRLHIVEGQLKDGAEGHGLDGDDTRVLMERLGELGYADPRTDVIETGRRHAYYVVTATNPG